MNLAWLLLGPGDLRRSRGFLAFLGVLLLAAGAVVAADASDPVTTVILEACGWLLVAYGLFKLAMAVLASEGGLPALFGIQGIAIVVSGLAVADFPGASEGAVPWLFALAILLNGMFQAAAALAIRYPDWAWLVVSGAVHLLLAGVIVLEWKLAAHGLVPLALGGGLAAGGLSLLRTSFRLGRHRPGPEGWTPERSVRWYLDFHMPQRFRRHYFPGPVQPPRETGGPHGELLVHVWMPAAGPERAPNPVRRYIAARDEAGKYTVGHAALEMSPDVYISHRDGDPTPYEGAVEVWQSMRARDVEGEFRASFQEELGLIGADPSVTVRFRNFREDQLRTFWAAYRQVGTYNFTNRNCSVAVAQALEAALMGTMARPRRLRAMLCLLLSRDLWMAHFLRRKAREMVWTPGIILDYALALKRVTER